MTTTNFPPQLQLSPSESPLDELLDGQAFGTDGQKEAITKYGIAGRVWEAAYALVYYLAPNRLWEFDPAPFTLHPRSPLTILELGSGTGFVAAHLAARILQFDHDVLIATDLPDVCPLLSENLSRHGVLVRPLPWGDSHYAETLAVELGTRRLTHIVCSDLVYFPELLAPLLRSLIQLTSPPFASAPTPTVSISYKSRSLVKETPFWVALGLWFHFEPVRARARRHEVRPWQRLGELLDDVHIFVCRRREESFGWSVPESDNALLAGSGAKDTSISKSDDTYETMLLMSMADITD